MSQSLIILLRECLFSHFMVAYKADCFPGAGCVEPGIQPWQDNMLRQLCQVSDRTGWRSKNHVAVQLLLLLMCHLQGLFLWIQPQHSESQSISQVFLQRYDFHSSSAN